VDGVIVRHFDDVAHESLPLALAELQHSLGVGARARVSVAAGWNRRRLGLVVAGAGFACKRSRREGTGPGARLLVHIDRLRTLPDTVGPGMRVLLVGLNPSVYSADRGIGFARPGNRFWPAALAAGLVTRDRDPFDALRTHAVGMTDLVKRATARADELTPGEYRAGTARVEALAEWLAPAAVCFVGLSGYRVAVDRTATAGWQAARFGGRAAYVMPNPSGLNAHATPAVLAEHLRTVRRGPA
jgi:TDG/mug DNA glycosylase family protein